MLIKRSPTPRLTASARSNGARSRGPSTAPGKAVSSRNSLRHGLYSKSAVLPTESADDLAALRREFLTSLKPRTFGELALVEEIVDAIWLRRRAEKVEDEAFERHMRLPEPGFPQMNELAAILGLTMRAGSRYSRRFFNAVDAFYGLRGTRKRKNDPVISLKTQHSENVEPAEPGGLHC